MKQILLIAFLMIIVSDAFSQNVGIGNSNPSTSLDVKGAIRTRPDTISVNHNYQLIDVSNSSYIRLIGTSGNPMTGNQYKIFLLPGKDGQHLRLESIAPYSLKTFAQLINGTFLSNGKRILLKDNETFYFGEAGMYIDLFYSDVTGWTETGRNTYTDFAQRSEDFNSSEFFTVPLGVTHINVVLWGAGGYGGGTGTGLGGNGGFVAATIAVSSEEVLSIVVNGAGYSAIKRGTTFLVLAAAGGNGSPNGGNGGNAGASGQNGTVGAGATGTAGIGATPASGGAGGTAGTGGFNGTAGSSLTGGNCNVLANDQGDGGSGFFGGGGSGTYQDGLNIRASGGGGGGSNYVNGAAVVVSHNTHVGQIIPAHPLYEGGGTGGTGSASGGAGRVIITW